MRPIEKLVAAIRKNAPTHQQTIEEARADFERMMGNAPKVEGVEVQADKIAGVPVEWVVPAGSDPSRVIMYFHGGGYAMGSVRTIRAMASHLALRTNRHVLTLDYRLAPEHPFPAALDDITAVYKAILDRFQSKNIAFSGDSAGGGLTVAALLRLRDEKLPLPFAGIPISPWLDMTLTAKSIQTNEESDPIVKIGNIQMFREAYLGSTSQKNPLASPLFADLTGLPPLLVQVGAGELLVDDAKSFVSRAKEQGVDAKLASWPDMVHVWHMYAPRLPEALEAMDEIGAFLREKGWG